MSAPPQSEAFYYKWKWDLSAKYMYTSPSALAHLYPKCNVQVFEKAHMLLKRILITCKREVYDVDLVTERTHCWLLFQVALNLEKALSSKNRATCNMGCHSKQITFWRKQIPKSAVCCAEDISIYFHFNMRVYIRLENRLTRTHIHQAP